MTPACGRRLAALVVSAAVVVALAAGCQRGAEVAGEGRLEPDGRVLLTRDEEATTVARPRSLVAGDAVEVAAGSAKVLLPGGDVIELRPRSILIVDRGPELRSGSALVTASGTPRTVRAAGNQVDAAGATRIDVSLALRVVAYGGRAVVRSGGRTLEVPALREASVPVVGVPRGPRPLAIDRDDLWDQRLLGEAATREPDLESRARGFSGQVAPKDASSLGYYRNLLPGLDDEAAFQQAAVDRLGRAALDGAPPVGADRFRAGDVLLGAAIALQGRQGTFAERLSGAEAFRTEGASWALVSLDQQVPSIDGLLRLVDGAVNVAPLELAAPGPRATTAAVPEPPPGQATPPTSPPRTRAAPATGPTRSTATTVRAPSQPQPQQPQPQQPQQPPSVLQPLDPLLDVTVDPVVNLLNDLVGGG